MNMSASPTIALRRRLRSFDMSGFAHVDGEKSLRVGICDEAKP